MDKAFEEIIKTEQLKKKQREAIATKIADVFGIKLYEPFRIIDSNQLFMPKGKFAGEYYFTDVGLYSIESNEYIGYEPIIWMIKHPETVKIGFDASRIYLYWERSQTEDNQLNLNISVDYGRQFDIARKSEGNYYIGIIDAYRDRNRMIDILFSLE